MRRARRAAGRQGTSPCPTTGGAWKRAVRCPRRRPGASPCLRTAPTPRGATRRGGRRAYWTSPACRATPPTHSGARATKTTVGVFGEGLGREWLPGAAGPAYNLLYAGARVTLPGSARYFAWERALLCLGARAARERARHAREAFWTSVIGALRRRLTLTPRPSLCRCRG